MDKNKDINNTELILNKLPEYMKNEILKLPKKVLDNFEELRVKAEFDTLVISGGIEYALKDNKLTTTDVLEDILNRLLDYSYYAYEDELVNGFVTIEGGHRVGICGRVALKEGKVHIIKEISSINIRKSREIIGASDKIIDTVVDRESGIISNTLIISPPKCGKTTLIRDLARVLSSRGYRVSICDERSEIAGCFCGKPSYDLGSRVDILDRCPKAQGIRMLVRSMSPDIVITDEIGKQEDMSAIEEALNAGVKVITTIHGNSFENVVASSAGGLIKSGSFDTLIFLSSKPVTGTIERVMKISE